ncbi:MAG: hypothetical protein ACOC8L_12850 [Spirochaetota bacterium]
MRLNKRVVGIAIAALVLIFGSCTNPSGGSTGTGNGDLAFELSWDVVDGQYVYRTRDVDKLGRTMSITVTPGTPPANNTESEIEIVKKSGRSDTLLGMVFNHVDYKSDYEFLVTIDGYWSLYKTENLSRTAIASGTLPASVSHDYGQPMTLNASYPGDGSLTLRVNGVQVHKIDTGFVTFNGYGTGGTFSISDNENFPDEPVEIRFRITKPIAAPW